jgi:hypothetical protein
MPEARDVLFYKDFEFEDGSKHNKLFIVICSEVSCLVLKTTKNNKLYQGVKDGCNPPKRVFFIPTDKKEFFDIDTYVQLPQLYEITIPELLQGSFSKKISVYKSALSENCLQQIRACLRNFKEDITPEHWDFIFSRGRNTPTDDSLQKLTSKFNKNK